MSANCYGRLLAFAAKHIHTHTYSIVIIIIIFVAVFAVLNYLISSLKVQCFFFHSFFCVTKLFILVQQQSKNSAIDTYMFAYVYYYFTHMYCVCIV